MVVVDVRESPRLPVGRRREVNRRPILIDAVGVPLDLLLLAVERVLPSGDAFTGLDKYYKCTRLIPYTTAATEKNSGYT